MRKEGESESLHEHDGEDECTWLLMEDLDEDEGGFEEVISKKLKKKNGKANIESPQINAAVAEAKESLMVVEEVRGKWVRVSAGVDSCASNTVIPVTMFPNVPKRETKESKSGKTFTAANGGKIKNEGEKVIPFQTSSGENRKVRGQLAKVTRMLISVSKMNKAGYKVSLDPDNPHIQDTKTKKITKLRHKNGIFLIDLWIDTSVTGPVFTGQGK